jgi:uncharacterized oligopeptide transporter (OPT) family protein
LGALILSVICQVTLFSIPAWVAVLAVLMTFLLAVVAARVSGETGVTPVGPMGKVTQFSFGMIDPGSTTSNLMAANVTGGAASQCADLLHDMKTGLMIGASPRYQALSQFFGIMAGALIGSWAYLILVPDPSTMLLTEEWQAPAVAQWKAVAELLRDGFSQLEVRYPGATQAMVWAALAGICLSILEKTLPKKLARFVPSGAGIGLAFCITGYYSISMLVGAIFALIASKISNKWHVRFTIVLASGLVAGESIVGVFDAIFAVDWAAFAN